MGKNYNQKTQKEMDLDESANSLIDFAADSPQYAGEETEGEGLALDSFLTQNNGTTDRTMLQQSNNN